MYNCYVACMSLDTFVLSAYAIMRFYNVNRQVTKVVKLYLTWPFLPKAEMPAGLRYIRRLIGSILNETARKALKAFHQNYMRKFWNQKITPARLSVYGLVKRTTNDLESLHRRMRVRLPQRPIFLRFVHHLTTNIFEPATQLLVHINNDDQLPAEPKRSQRERNE